MEPSRITRDMDLKTLLIMTLRRFSAFRPPVRFSLDMPKVVEVYYAVVENGV